MGIDPLVITAIDTSDGAGKIALLANYFSLGKIVYISGDGVKTFVDEVLTAAGTRKIARLNVIDHGSKKSFQVGKESVHGGNISTVSTDLGRLNGRFAPNGFIYFFHCNVGNDEILLTEVARSTGVPVYAGIALTGAFDLKNRSTVYGFEKWGGFQCTTSDLMGKDQTRK